MIAKWVQRNPITMEGWRVFNVKEKRDRKTSPGSGQLRAVIGSLHNVFVFH